MAERFIRRSSVNVSNLNPRSHLPNLSRFDANCSGVPLDSGVVVLAKSLVSS